MPEAVNRIYAGTECDDCDIIDVTNAASDIKKRFEKLFKRVFDKKMKSGQIDKDTYLATSKEMEKALNNDFDIDMNKVDYDSPDLVMRNHLKRNLFAFSGAKNYAQFEEMRDNLLDDDGNIRKYSDFKKKALDINERYNTNWLKTEYNNAVATSQSASKWVNYEKNKDIYPYLEYRTAGDSRVRSSHQAMSGIVKHKDDTFWDINYPPNGWHCRCRAVQTSGRGKEVTRDDEAQRRSEGAVPDKSFRQNAGKSKVVFKDNHPYFKAAPNEMKAVENYGLQELDKLVKKKKNAPGRDDVTSLNPDDIDAVNKEAGYKVRFTKRQIEDSSISHHAVEGVNKADEVWSTSEDIVFLRYYQGEVIEVVAKMTDKGVKVDSWSFKKTEKVTSRKGVLEKIER